MCGSGGGSEGGAFDGVYVLGAVGVTLRLTGKGDEEGGSGKGL